MLRVRLVGVALSVACLVAAVAVGPGAAAAEPCLQVRDDAPCLTYEPASGAPGTYVTFSGQVDPEDIRLWAKTWRQLDLWGMYRAFPDGGPTGTHCELMVPLRKLRIDFDKESGAVSGSFTLGSHGNCMQEERSFPAFPGRYNLVAGCTACVFGEYRVSAGVLPTTGSDAGTHAAVGIAFLVLGGVALAQARRSKREGVRH